MVVKLVGCNAQLERLAWSAHSNGSLRWGTIVASCTYTATVAHGPGCHVVGGLWWGWGGSRERLRWLASANVKTCGTKAGEMCRESAVAVLLLVSSLVKSAGFACRAGHWESQSLSLHFSLSGFGEIKVGHPCGVVP